MLCEPVVRSWHQQRAARCRGYEFVLCVIPSCSRRIDEEIRVADPLRQIDRSRGGEVQISPFIIVIVFGEHEKYEIGRCLVALPGDR